MATGPALSDPPQPLRLQILSLPSCLFTQLKLHGIMLVLGDFVLAVSLAKNTVSPDLHVAHSLSPFSSLFTGHLGGLP